MEQSNTSKVAKGISSQTLVTLLAGVEGIVYFSIMSRLLSREDFGLFAAVTAVTGIFLSISNAGIGSALIQRKEMTEDFKNTSFTLAVIVSGIVAVFLCLSSAPLAKLIVGDELKVPLMLMSVTIFLNGVISVYLSWMRRHLEFLKAGMVQLVASVLSSIIAVILALFGFGFYAIMFKVISSSVITFLICIFVTSTRFNFFLKLEYVKGIVHFGGWLTASVILHSISVQIDRLLMPRILSVEALGAYNRPKEFILQIGSKINDIFDTALFPVLSSIQDNKSSLRNAFNRSQYLMNICTMALALSFICNADLLIRIFFGEKWLDLKPIFQIISITLIFNINGRLGDCYLRSLGMVRLQFNLRLLGLFISVSCILIGSKYGIMGVAIGFLISNIILITIKTFYLAKKLDISGNVVIRNVLGGWAYGFYFLPMVIIQYLYIPNNWVCNIILAFIFVTLMCLLFVVFPSMIGAEYKEYAYSKVQDKLKQTFSKIYGK